MDLIEENIHRAGAINVQAKVKDATVFDAVSYTHLMVDAGCDCVVMEVSSQGLMLHRTQGFVFDYGIFTNIEPDVYKRQDLCNKKRRDKRRI